MKKIIQECNNYQIDNPYQYKEPLKYTFMRIAFNKYKKIKISLADKFPKIFPLKEWQENMWGRASFPFNDGDNSVEFVINNKSNTREQAFFNLEFMHLLELIPKEQLDAVIRGIDNFKSKHCSNSMFDRFEKTAEYFKVYWSGTAFTLLGSMSIRKDSDLYPYISQITFKLINITNSFCALSVSLLLNSDLKGDISKFITSNVKNKINVSGFENKKWYQFTNLGNGYRSGKIIKHELLEEILTDIKWRVSKKLFGYIPMMVLSSHKINLPSITSFETNIDGNLFGEFWESLNVSPQRCDFIENYSGCLAWGAMKTNLTYIYSRSNDIYSSILAVDIDKYVCSYLIANEVDRDFRKKLVVFSKKMTSIAGKNIKHWLRLKIKMDTSLLYYSRFISECQIKEAKYSRFVRLDKSKEPIIQSYEETINNRIDEAQKTYQSIMSLFQSNADYRNLKESYKIQKIILITTIISVIVAIISAFVAIIALFVTTQTYDEATQTIGNMWSIVKKWYNSY